MRECECTDAVFHETTGPWLRDPASLAASGLGREFTQPRAQSFAELCSRGLIEGNGDWYTSNNATRALFHKDDMKLWKPKRQGNIDYGGKSRFKIKYL